MKNGQKEDSTTEKVSGLGSRGSTPPTKEEVHTWIKRDITAASYFLGMLLQNPDLIKTLSDQLYDRIMSEQQGALIDHIEKRKEAKNGG